MGGKAVGLIALMVAAAAGGWYLHLRDTGERAPPPPPAPPSTTPPNRPAAIDAPPSDQSGTAPGSTDHVEGQEEGDESPAPVVLDEGNALVFRILDQEGKPVPGGEARVHFIAEDGRETLDARPFKDGRCTHPLPERPAARMWIEVGDAVNAEGQPFPLGQGIYGPFPVEAGAREVRLPPERALEGRLVDSAGSVEFEGPVTLEIAPEGIPGGGDWTTAAPGTALSGVGGRFRIGRLGDFPYLLHVGTSRRFLPPAPIPVRPGTRDLVVTLKAAATPMVTVLGPDGEEVVNAHVYAREVEALTSARTDAGHTGVFGLLRLKGLDPDHAYSLEVEPPREHEDLLPAKVGGWKPADTTVRLARGFTLTVLVKGRDGVPLEGIPVDLGPEGAEPTAYEQTDASGRIPFRGLPAGHVRIQAGFYGEEGAPLTRATTTVPSDAGEVALEVDPGSDVAIHIRGWREEWHADVHLLPTGGGVPEQPGVSPDGTVRLRGIRKGRTFDILIRRTAIVEGEIVFPGCALLRGVKAGDPPTEVDLVTGRLITGKVVLPEGVETYRVRAEPGPLVECTGQENEDGTFTIPGLPEGMWTVVVSCSTPDGKDHEATVSAMAGATVEIRVP